MESPPVLMIVRKPLPRMDHTISGAVTFPKILPPDLLVDGVVAGRGIGYIV
jgi:hypothetical protein